MGSFGRAGSVIVADGHVLWTHAHFLCGDLRAFGELADFRGDLKEERAMRERQAIATNENTTVTRDMTVAMVSLTAAINQIKGR